MELTWKSTLLLAVLASLAAWWLERKFAAGVKAVAAPVVAAAQGAAQADPMARGSIWGAIKDSIEIPIGGSTAAVDRWLAGS